MEPLGFLPPIVADAAAAAELEAVARRLAQAIREAEAVPAEERPRLLVFRAGGRRLSVALTALREVVIPGPLSLVPRAPAALLGIMNLRGRVVLVADLVLVLGAPPEKTGSPEDARVLLLEARGREVGLLVAGVEGIVAPGSPEEQGTTPLVPEEVLETIAALAS